jgi:hypothetical protein
VLRMEPGTRLILVDDTWQPVPEEAPAPDECITLLVEGFVAFLDGEVARMGPPGDELELFEGAVMIPEEAMRARPAAPGRDRQRWAQQIYRDFIAHQVRQLRGPAPAGI